MPRLWLRSSVPCRGHGHADVCGFSSATRASLVLRLLVSVRSPEVASASVADFRQDAIPRLAEHAVNGSVPPSADRRPMLAA